MDENTHHQLNSDPDKIVQYIDYQSNPVPDNSHYIPDLVPGVLQPLEVIEEDPEFDSLLQNLDVEALVKEADDYTAKYEASIKKDYHHFPDPSDSTQLGDFSKRKYAPSMRKKVMWAGRIFEQWKCIQNYKLKQ